MVQLGKVIAKRYQLDARISRNTCTVQLLVCLLARDLQLNFYRHLSLLVLRFVIELRRNITMNMRF